jgi:hypothetical protein
MPTLLSKIRAELRSDTVRLLRVKPPILFEEIAQTVGLCKRTVSVIAASECLSRRPGRPRKIVSNK